MERNYFISVAMATYNGEKYIKKQFVSILKNLNQFDELVISDDGSTDNTLRIIKSFHDSRIQIWEGPKMGVKQNFANAIAHCKGKYIFLSDQDDIWDLQKVKVILETFKKEKCDCITHDCKVVNSDGKKTMIDSFFDYRKSKPGIVRNIYKNRYLGCCMAFHKNMLKYILPIPNHIEMHDQWIGILAEKYGKSIFIPEKLLFYRRHDKNASSMQHYPFMKMIKNRFNLIVAITRR